MNLKILNIKEDDKIQAILDNEGYKWVLEEENKPNYKKGYNIMADYFDSIPDDEKEEVGKQLEEVGL
jgi:hypothetical protein